MGNGDLSTDLGVGILTPTPAVRPAQGNSPGTDAEGKARRRPRAEPEESNNEATGEAGEGDAHQIDHLA